MTGSAAAKTIADCKITLDIELDQITYVGTYASRSGHLAIAFLCSDGLTLYYHHFGSPDSYCTDWLIYEVGEPAMCADLMNLIDVLDFDVVPR